MLKNIVLAAILFASSSAHAVSVTATVIADDYYKVFVGDASGTNLTQVGGSGDSLWFYQGTSFSFDIAAGQYLYIAAWDSASYGPPHMWIGDFNVNGSHLVSNTTDWIGENNITIKNPSLSDVEALAQSGNWSALSASAADGSPSGNGGYPKFFSDSTAQRVWTDSFNGDSASENGYALFRTSLAVIPVPEPESYALMLAGLGLLAGQRLRLARRKA